MEIPTTVLENGQWVTRMLDPYQILARDRAKRENRAEPVLESPKPPTLALLTQTLTSTPVVKWILPARIRSETRNDVLFISEDAVQIKEARRDYSLDHVVVKSDFDSPIRAARIFGLPRESTKPDLSAIIKKEDEDYWLPDENTLKIEGREQSSQSDDDNEHDGTAAGERPSSENAQQDAVHKTADAASIAQPDYRHLPPQLLILVLESEKIVFLYATSGPADRPHLVTSQRPLPHSSSRLEQLGETIAIDPRSRAFAVAAYENTFYLYALKSHQRLRKELKKSASLMPIKAERAFRVDGTILKMEFLHPVQGDGGHVILLLVVSKNNRSHLLWYEWNYKDSLHDARISPTTHKLPSEDRLPLLLIPLLAFNAFILISEIRISVYKHLLTGTPDCFIHELAHEEEAEEPARSKNSPMWVQWARPMRSPSRRTSHDHIYICREDGIVRYVDIKYEIPCLLDSNHNAGKLGVNIDSSFAVIDFGPAADDVLVAGGDSSEGGHWLFPAREAAENLIWRPNWTPLLDGVLTAAANENTRTLWDPSLKPRNAGNHRRLFASTGKARHGSVAELRYGVGGSQSPDSVDLDVAVSGNAMSICVLRPTKVEVAVMINYPTRSSIVRIIEGLEPQLLEECVGIDLDAKTLAATSTPNGMIFQVTEKGVYGNPGPGLISSVCSWKHVLSGTRERIAAAVIEPGESGYTVAFASQEDDRFYLNLASMGAALKILGEQVALQAQPTCIALRSSKIRFFVIVGNIEGAIEIFVGTYNVGLALIAMWQFKDAFGICDSVAMLDLDDGQAPLHDDSQDLLTNSHDALDQILLVCGLRNGHIHTLGLSYDVSALITCHEQIAVGHTSITAKADTTSGSRVILQCDQNLYALDYRLGSTGGPVGVLNPILLDNLQRPEVRQDGSIAFCQTEVSYNAGDPQSGILISLENTSLRFMKLGHAGARTIPRRWQLGGTPARMLYSERLSRLVTLSLETVVVRPRRTNGFQTQAGKRALRPIVTFLDVNNGSNGAARNLDAMDTDGDMAVGSGAYRQALNYKPGEKFLGITEWFPKIGSNHYHIFIFNTMIKDSQKPLAGRLLFYAVTVAEDSTARLAMKKAIDLPSPVYTVAPMPIDPSVMYSCGNELVVLTLDPHPDGFRFEPPIKTMLRSPGRHLSIHEDLVYVSTAAESVQVYRLEDNELGYQFGDTVARDGLHHVNIPSRDLVLGADMSGSVFGLWQPPERYVDNAMTTVFEAALPRAINRLLPMTRPQWTIDVLIPGSGIFLKDRSASPPPFDPPSASRATDVPDPEHLRDQRPASIIGTSTDGTITQLQILATGWRLLRFVQNMCERHPLLCPLRTEKPRRHIEPRTDNPRFMHIDGDVLKRLLERGGMRLLAAMLESPVPGRESEERFVDFDGVQDRWGRFGELAEEVLGTGFGSERGGREVLLSEVVRWIAYVLRSAL